MIEVFTPAELHDMSRRVNLIRRVAWWRCSLLFACVMLMVCACLWPFVGFVDPIGERRAINAMRAGPNRVIVIRHDPESKYTYSSSDGMGVEIHIIRNKDEWETAITNASDAAMKR